MAFFSQFFLPLTFLANCWQLLIYTSNLKTSFTIFTCQSQPTLPISLVLVRLACKTRRLLAVINFFLSLAINFFLLFAAINCPKEQVSDPRFHCNVNAFPPTNKMEREHCYLFRTQNCTCFSHSFWLSEGAAWFNLSGLKCENAILCDLGIFWHILAI